MVVYLITDFAVHGDFHGYDLAVQASVQHCSEVAEFAFAAEQPCEVDHFMLWRFILAISGVFVCVHGSWGGC